jgi:hypothetical protein
LIVPVIAGVAIGIAGVTIGIISQERVAKQLVNGLGQPSTAPTPSSPARKRYVDVG